MHLGFKIESKFDLFFPDYLVVGASLNFEKVRNTQIYLWKVNFEIFFFNNMCSAGFTLFSILRELVVFLSMALLI